MYAPLARSDYYGASAPRLDHRSATEPVPASSWRPDPGTGKCGSHVHCSSISQVGTSSAPAASPRLRRRSSAWPPRRPTCSGFGVDSGPIAPSPHTAHQPVSTRFELAQVLRDFSRWFSCVTPSDFACRTHTVWRCQRVPALAGLLSALPGVSRLRLPPTSTESLRRLSGGGLSPPLDETAPRGAP